MGKLKAMPIAPTDQHTLQVATIHDNIKVGSRLYTGVHRGYIGLDGASYQHKTVKHSAKEYVSSIAYTNGVERVWTVLKRGYNGSYHHCSKKHCRTYVNELAFRLNDGNCERDAQDRLDSLFSRMAGRQITYKKLIK